MKDAGPATPFDDDIYDAVLAPAGWPKVIERIVGHVGGVAGWLMTRQHASGAGRVLHGFGDRPERRQRYFEKYVWLDPAGPHLLSLAAGDIAVTSRMASPDDFAKSHFYREWMAPQGWRDCLSLVLDRSPTQVTALMIARGRTDGAGDEDACRRMRAVAPVLRRAVLLASALDHRAAQEAALAETFDQLSAAVLFLDGGGRILHCNARGKDLLAQGDLAGVMTAWPGAGEPMLEPGFHEQMRRALRPSLVADVRSAAIPLRSARGCWYVAHGLSLIASQQRRPGPAHRAVAVLFVRKAELAGEGVAELAGSHYQLTPMELRVLMSIVETGQAPETAAALGIAQSTVRTHLRSVFAKTGTGRQRDLARLIAGFSSTLLR